MQSVIQNRSARGWLTLLELMIAFAIISILLALAVPAYSNYKIRAKITECVNGAAAATAGIAEYRQSLGAWPPDLHAAGLLDDTGTSFYCTAIDDYQSTTGAFTIDVNEAAVDSVLSQVSPVLVPTVTSSNKIDWKCTPGSTRLEDLKYLPSMCQDG